MAIKNLTVAEAEAAYVADPSVCPYCGNFDLEGEGVDIQDNGRRAMQEITCSRCYASFYTYFTLTRVSVTSLPEKEEDDE